MAGDIVGDLFTAVDTLGAGAVQTLYTRIGAALQPVFIAGVTIYIALWGYSLVTGGAHLTAHDMISRMLKVAVVGWLAFSWGDFQVYVYDVLTRTPDGLAQVICTAAGGASCGPGSSGVSQALSAIWTTANTSAKGISSAAGMTGVGLMILAYIVILLAGLFVAFAIFLTILGKMALMVVMALAPIFICMALFDMTYRFFDGWFRLVMQYALVPVVVYGLLGFFLILMKQSIDALANSPADGDKALTIVAPFMLMCVVGSLLLSQVLAITAAIAGGAGLHGPRLAGVAAAAFGGMSATAARGRALGRAGTLKTTGRPLAAAGGSRMSGGGASMRDGSEQVADALRSARK